MMDSARNFEECFRQAALSSALLGPLPHQNQGCAFCNEMTLDQLPVPTDIGNRQDGS
jgi:hypothetical protein